jgi:hypothetical protein
MNDVISVSDVDECAAASSNECDKQASCTNNQGSYSCTCKPGWTGATGLSGNCKGRFCVFYTFDASRPAWGIASLRQTTRYTDCVEKSCLIGPRWHDAVAYTIV